jgi:hypothetical protein
MLEFAVRVEQGRKQSSSPPLPLGFGHLVEDHCSVHTG